MVELCLNGRRVKRRISLILKAQSGQKRTIQPTKEFFALGALAYPLLSFPALNCATGDLIVIVDEIKSDHIEIRAWIKNLRIGDLSLRRQKATLAELTKLNTRSQRDLERMYRSLMPYNGDVNKAQVIELPVVRKEPPLESLNE